MKKIVVLKTLIGLLVFFSSCKKQKMPLGKYSFTFKYTGEVYTTTPPTLYYEIVESTRDYIVLGGSYQDTLYKEGKNITGTLTYYGPIPGMGLSTYYSPFHITGVYDKSKGIYYINGTFVSKIFTPNPEEQRMDSVDTSGTFEFKQFFME